MITLKVYFVFLLIFSFYLSCKKESTTEPQINTTPVNSVADAVTLGTKAYTLGYHYTVEPYFGFTREIAFETQSPSYNTADINFDPYGRRKSYSLICIAKNDTMYRAEYTNIAYDTYDRVDRFKVIYSFSHTSNTYDFDVKDIIRENQGQTQEYTADITADVNGKTVSGVLTYP
jgi:hypothetical protein